LKKSPHQIFLNAFGSNLKVVRKRLGYSQERLAYEADIELRQIGRIERGEINTGILSLKIIAETLGIHYKELMDFDI
jgi:transcriptional regulator with XRE-family HTH domain